MAYERFTKDGPVALLPMDDSRCAVVCTMNGADAPAALAANEAEFAALLHHRFGDRLGDFSRIGRRQAYPLFLLKSREHTRHRVAIIGNAAHTLHPIAGQGFNLGIRDVAALAEVVADAWRDGRDIGDQAVLDRYADWRRWDQRQTIAITDALTRLFVNPLPPVRAVRNLGLLAFDLCSPIKHWFARQSMGLDGRSEHGVGRTFVQADAGFTTDRLNRYPSHPLREGLGLGLGAGEHYARYQNRLRPPHRRRRHGWLGPGLRFGRHRFV